MPTAQHTQQAYEQICKLRKQIHTHNYLYHQQDSPVISDQAYDKLFQELIELEATYPQFFEPDSPSARVGYTPRADLPNVQHSSPMLSLQNIFHDNGFLQFAQRCQTTLDTAKLIFTVEPKLDGLAMSLTYRHGKLTLAATRGDGTEGEDVTHTVRTITNLPLALRSKNSPEYLVVRGEIVMSLRGFRLLNQHLELQGKKTFANPRNAAAGSIRVLDSKIAARRPLLFYAYALTEHQPTLKFTGHSDSMAYLQRIGFVVNPHMQLCEQQSAVIEHHRQLEAMRDSFDYLIDGTVIKINNVDQQQTMGFVARAPRWAVAWKFAAKQVDTTLLDVHFNVGRTGVLTPVAKLAPVHLDGVTIGHASLHNMDEIARLGVMIGDQVTLQRAGDVIPQIVSAQPGGNRQSIQIPNNCPECGSPVYKPQDQVVWRCPAKSTCRAQLSQLLQHYCSRRAMDIVGLGGKWISKLLDNGIICSLSDIYHIHQHKQTLIAFDGMGEKSFAKLVHSIEKSKATSLSRFMYALGIEGVGEVTAGQLAMHFPNITNLMDAQVEQIAVIDGVGMVIATQVHEYFSNQTNRQQIARIQQAGVHWQVMAKQPLPTQTLAATRFVITGSFAKSRDELASLLKQHGAKVSTSVSKNTSYVLCGENAGSKLEKAQQLGVPVIDIAKLEALLAQSGV